MLALAISMEKDKYTKKLEKKNQILINLQVTSDIAESNFTMTSHSKFILPVIYATLCLPEL